MNSNDLTTKQDLLELEARLIAIITKSQKDTSDKSRKWIRSKEVRQLLNISPGKLQSLRTSGVLPYSRIDKTLYYDLEDVDHLLEKNKVNVNIDSRI